MGGGGFHIVELRDLCRLFRVVRNFLERPDSRKTMDEVTCYPGRRTSNRIFRSTGPQPDSDTGYDPTDPVTDLCGGGDDDHPEPGIKTRRRLRRWHGRGKRTINRSTALKRD